MRYLGATAPACWSWPIPTSHDGTLAALIEWHNDRCAVCNNHFRAGPLALIRDHDHTTGLIRGYLCRSCNTTEPKRTDGAFAMYRERPPPRSSA